MKSFFKSYKDVLFWLGGYGVLTLLLSLVFFIIIINALGNSEFIGINLKDNAETISNFNNCQVQR